MAGRRSAGALVALAAVGGLLVPLAIAARSVVKDAVVPDATPESVLARLPLAFEANQGQFGPGVRFLARSPGQNVVLTESGLRLSPSGVSLTLEGARHDAPAQGLDPLPGHVSRLVGDDPSRWTAGAATFGSVAYRQVYPGVDVVFHGRGRDVEHDYVVAPGVDPRVIAFSVDGAPAHVDDGGDLVVGDVTLRAPELYQDQAGLRGPSAVAGRRHAVRGAFEPRGASTFGFTVGPYDPSRPLVIDPVIVSASYLGGSSTDTAYGVVTDADGHMILTGYTESSDFQTLNPAQAGQAASEGPRTDIFVSKVRADGSSLLWSTYIGGKGRDAALGVAIGPDGSTYLTGYTESSDFPTTRPIKNTSAGGSDVFVVKLNPTGTAIDFSTYIGGSGTDTGNGIAVDPNGGVYVAGTTGSSNFPTAKPFQPGLSKPDDQDAFVLKIESSLTSLAWSSYLGGSGDDHATDVTVDPAGNVYLTGDTKSTNFPVSRPFQPTPGGSGAGVGGTFADAFVAKINRDGSGLVFGSYLGGSDSDKGSGIAIDAEANVFVTGNTGSSNFPVVNAAQAKKDGDFDAFVAKVKADGTGLAYSTYVGGSGSDGAEGIVVDSAGRATVVGATASTNFPTEKPFQSAKGGGFVDAFVTSVSPPGSSFASSSYLGGRDDDQAAGVALDRTGNIAVVGYTNSADFPIAKPFQPGRGGGVGDAFVAKVREDVAGASSGSGATTTERDKRVRTLITLTGLLLLAAGLQTFWLRRRHDRKAKPAPAGPDGGGDAPLPGVAYTPRQSAVRHGPVPADDERETQPVPTGAFADQVAAVRVGAPAPAPETWGPERPRKRSPGPEWTTSDRPLLRPLERAPASVAPAQMPAPDLWDPAEPTPSPVPVARAIPRVPARAAAAPVARVAATGPFELAPEDVWGPLSGSDDPDEVADAWGVDDGGAAAAFEIDEVDLVAEPVAEPVVEPVPEPVHEPVVERVVAPQPPPPPEPFGANDVAEPEAEEWDAAVFPLPESEEPQPGEWGAAAVEPVGEPVADPFAPGAASPELSIDELLDENLPIPEPQAVDGVRATQAGDGVRATQAGDGVRATQAAHEPEQVWLGDLLDEEFPIPEPSGQGVQATQAGHGVQATQAGEDAPSEPVAAGWPYEPPGPPQAPPAPPRRPAPIAPPPVTEWDPEAAEWAEQPAPQEGADGEEFLPPAPDRLLQNMFEPDPDDPLVKATQKRRRGRGR